MYTVDANHLALMITMAAKEAETPFYSLLILVFINT